MLSLWKSFNRLFDDLYVDVFGDSWRFPTEGLTINPGLTHKRMEDGSFVTTISLPGLTENDISVEATNKTLTVKASKNTKTSKSSVTTSFLVPSDCDLSAVKAEFKDEVLTLSVPGTQLPPQPETKKIPINSSST